MKTFYNRKDRIPRRQACLLCNTITRPLGICSPASCKAERETFPGVKGGQRHANPNTQYPPLLPSFHSDLGSFTLLATQNCQYLCQKNNDLISLSVYTTALAQPPWSWAKEKSHLPYIDAASSCQWKSHNCHPYSISLELRNIAKIIQLFFSF